MTTTNREPCLQILQEICILRSPVANFVAGSFGFVEGGLPRNYQACHCIKIKDGGKLKLQYIATSFAFSGESILCLAELKFLKILQPLHSCPLLHSQKISNYLIRYRLCIYYPFVHFESFFLLIHQVIYLGSQPDHTFGEIVLSNSSTFQHFTLDQHFRRHFMLK